MIGRVEEILEVEAIVSEAADRLALILERSGADELHDPQGLRALARHELGLAAADVGLLAFGSQRGA